MLEDVRAFLELRLDGGGSGASCVHAGNDRKKSDAAATTQAANFILNSRQKSKKAPATEAPLLCRIIRCSAKTQSEPPAGTSDSRSSPENSA